MGRVWLVGALLLVALAAAPAVRSADLYGCSFEDSEQLVRMARSGGTRVLDHEGGFLAGLGRYFGPPVKVDRLPRHLIEALIAQEDRRFREHGGIDVRGLARAAVANVRAMRFVEGGSTLTQQVLKNACFANDPELWRKFKELTTAAELETALSKDEILYVYLNTVSFGRQAYGVQAAARLYFGKYAQELTVKESAVLVQILPQPSVRNPHRDPQGAIARAERVIDMMVKQGRLSPKAGRSAKAQKVKLVPSQGAVPGYYAGGRLDVGWFATWAARAAAARTGPPEGVPTVRTTLWPELQRIAADRLAAAVKAHGKRLGFDSGAVVVMSPVGEVLAMVGGTDFDRSEWNNVTQARRQPGSAFKLFVYLEALERGLTPASMVDDSLLELRQATIRNHDDTYRGMIPLEEAFARSSNPAAVRLAMGHVPAIQAMARRLGIASELTPEVGLALGIGEVTLLELVAAYAAIANGGRPVTPRGVVKVEDGFERTVWCEPSGRAEPVLAGRHVQAMRGMLAAVVTRGTGKAADPGFFAAGKTGTTDGFHDAVFVGFTERFVAGVWLGNEKRTPMKGVTGGGLPARLWRDIMRDAAKLERYRRVPCTSIDRVASAQPDR